MKLKVKQKCSFRIVCRRECEIKSSYKNENESRKLNEVNTERMCEIKVRKKMKE